MHIIIPGINWEKPKNGQNEKRHHRGMNQEIQFFNGLISEPSVDIMKSYKGTGGASKTDEFSEKFQRIGGPILIQKLISHILDL